MHLIVGESLLEDDQSLEEAGLSGDSEVRGYERMSLYTFMIFKTTVTDNCLGRECSDMPSHTGTVCPF